MRSTINAVFYTSTLVVGETATRAVVVSSTSAFVRYLIDLIIPEE
jgi:hypothetical protein